MLTGQIKINQAAGALEKNKLSWVFHNIAAIIFGLLLARWTWILFAPHSLVALTPQAEDTGTASAALFGTAELSGISERSMATVANLHLVGVFTGRQGFAVFRLDEKRQLGVAVGDEISKGIRLIEVAADYALIELNGVQQRVNLENKFANNQSTGAKNPSLSSLPNEEPLIKRWNEARRTMQNAAKSSNASR